MKTIIGAIVIAILAGLGIVGPASADIGPVRETSVKSLSFQYENGQVCHNVKVVANGEVLVEDVGCQP